MDAPLNNDRSSPRSSWRSPTTCAHLLAMCSLPAFAWAFHLARSRSFMAVGKMSCCSALASDWPCRVGSGSS
eukprot:15483840-Alexandrium_andersonii.AAC.1